jgi:uncharacterized protein YjbK
MFGPDDEDLEDYEREYTLEDYENGECDFDDLCDEDQDYLIAEARAEEREQEREYWASQMPF